MTNSQLTLCIVGAIALNFVGCEKPATNAPIATNTAAAPTAGARAFTAEYLEFACGVCIYHMPGMEGCPLAVVIDGTPHMVDGFEWPVHDYCDRKCHAIATGTLKDGRFIATSVEPKD